ncbi:MAG TPA: glycosyltransferase [Blastocatellia bacterium]|nr:glycosyltransferase [Blastocatellia bacterium]
MRLSIIGPAYPLRGGIAHHAYRLRQGLIARGHAVQVISFRKLYPSLFFPGTTEVDTSKLRLDAGAKAILTPLNPRTWLEAIKEVKSFAPDAVMFQWWQPFFAPLVGSLARAFGRAGIRRIIECHNILPHESTPVDRLLLKFAFKSADCFITHSNKDRELLAALVGERRISVSRLPALDEFRAPGQSPRDGRRILFFGKVRKYKGLDVLLEAMPKVLSEIPCELVIAGEFYDSPDRYRRVIAELGIEGSVRIEDRYVPNEEVSGFFERADVLVLPYVTASQSGVARIAFSNALPVIASDAGGLSETVIENVNGLLFPARDSNALAERIIRYFANNLGPRFAETLRSHPAADSTSAIVEAIERALACAAECREPLG